jgi:hypothetical protein
LNSPRTLFDKFVELGSSYIYFKNHQKRLVTGLLPDPLGALTALPRPGVRGEEVGWTGDDGREGHDMKKKGKKCIKRGKEEA